MDNFQLLNVYRFCVRIQEEIHVKHVLPYDIKLMHILKSAIAHVIKKIRVFFMQYIICFKLSDLVINKSLKDARFILKKIILTNEILCSCGTS